MIVGESPFWIKCKLPKCSYYKNCCYDDQMTKCLQTLTYYVHMSALMLLKTSNSIFRKIKQYSFKHFITLYYLSGFNFIAFAITTIAKTLYKARVVIAGQVLIIKDYLKKRSGRQYCQNLRRYFKEKLKNFNQFCKVFICEKILKY